MADESMPRAIFPAAGIVVALLLGAIVAVVGAAALLGASEPARWWVGGAIAAAAIAGQVPVLRDADRRAVAATIAFAGVMMALTLGIGAAVSWATGTGDRMTTPFMLLVCWLAVSRLRTTPAPEALWPVAMAWLLACVVGVALARGGGVDRGNAVMTLLYALLAVTVAPLHWREGRRLDAAIWGAALAAAAVLAPERREGWPAGALLVAVIGLEVLARRRARAAAPARPG